ncbi:hypothetical protein [Nonomuraea africana]|uniref:Uncharacterized protein n=1 Tax=Nonomuraea africana TaxID=46171 RepID=A0ABR9KB27_9ACTN|nr:hypothetical protein [Nonomuraea africana]MBE1559216.1 hypothetical protein [Nonomuraea africana]
MESEKPDVPQLCGWCGMAIQDGTEVHGVVPDSSVTHASDPACDGQRFLTTCSREHLAALQEHYRRRPFIEEELWAGKIARALDRSEALTAEQLEEVTGLRREQIERCVAWLEAQVYRLH